MALGGSPLAGGEDGPLGAYPPPWVLERVVSNVADLCCVPVAVQVVVRLLHLPQPEGELALRCVRHLALPSAAAVAAHSRESLAQAPRGSGPGSAPAWAWGLGVYT